MNVTRIQQYGNGLYVHIATAYADRMNLKKSDLVSVRLTEQGLLISKLNIPEKGKEVTNDKE